MDICTALRSRWFDTAGLHGAPAGMPAVEREGVARARSAEQVADLVIVVLDRSRAMRRGR